MPVLKPISGHTSVRPAMRYLTKENRALAVDYINLEAPASEHERIRFDWASIMDSTRHELGNDVPWGKERARTYKHYIISPNPDDGIDLGTLRELATAWAQKHFGDFEVAIVYHDDNESRIPHAHVVVNNTNLETGRRLQDADPGSLNRSLQRMADDRSLRHFKNMEGMTENPIDARKADERTRPLSLQREYMRKAEYERVAKGEYSWTADIRARVRIARIIARNEAEYRGALSAMGVEMSDNSPKAPRRDWVYSFADRPTRRISGEKLGVSYGRESLLSSFELGGIGHLPDESEWRIARIAKSALEIDDLDGLNRLSRALSLIEANNISSMQDLRGFVELGCERKAWTDPDAKEAMELTRFIADAGILPEKTAEPETRIPASRRDEDSELVDRSLSDRDMETARQHDDPVRGQQCRGNVERGHGR